MKKLNFTVIIILYTHKMMESYKSLSDSRNLMGRVRSCQRFLYIQGRLILYNVVSTFYKTFYFENLLIDQSVSTQTESTIYGIPEMVGQILSLPL